MPLLVVLSISQRGYGSHSGVRCGTKIEKQVSKTSFCLVFLNAFLFPPFPLFFPLLFKILGTKYLGGAGHVRGDGLVVAARPGRRRSRRRRGPVRAASLEAVADGETTTLRHESFRFE